MGSSDRKFAATLFSAGSNRYNFKMFTGAGATISQKTVTDGMANMPAGIVGNATLNTYVKMTVVGTIGAAQAFSAGVAFANSSRFRGGRG